MMESVERTLGPQEQVTVLSNDSMSLEQMMDQVRSRLYDHPTILFVDFCGGSPYVVCKSCQETHPNSAVISGVNLPMLFSFFTKRNKLPFAELVEVVKSDGVRGIQLLSK